MSGLQRQAIRCNARENDSWGDGTARSTASINLTFVDPSRDEVIAEISGSQHMQLKEKKNIVLKFCDSKDEVVSQ